MSSLTSCFVGGDQATTPSTLLRSGGRLDLARQTAAANALVRDFIGSERAMMAADMCADPPLLAPTDGARSPPAPPDRTEAQQSRAESTASTAALRRSPIVHTRHIWQMADGR
eukprot:COSAG01_NODE_1666_length_9571_cov_4.915963_4_plen_113_part_00